MHWSILASALSLSLAVSASPTLTEIPTRAGEKRDVTFSNLPASEPKCTNVNTVTKLTATYTNDDIKAAISQAVDAIENDKQYSTNKKNAKYPHNNTPGNGQNGRDQWTDYNLPDCAQASDDSGKKAGFIEFPILRPKSVYSGGKTDAGPDRVLFQFVTDGDKSKTYTTQPNLVGNFKYAAYCGTAEHQLNGNNFVGSFQPCADSSGNEPTDPDGGAP